jgi:hypothetical protein
MIRSLLVTLFLCLFAGPALATQVDISSNTLFIYEDGVFDLPIWEVYFVDHGVDIASARQGTSPFQTMFRDPNYGEWIGDQEFPEGGRGIGPVGGGNDVSVSNRSGTSRVTWVRGVHEAGGVPPTISSTPGVDSVTVDWDCTGCTVPLGSFDFLALNVYLFNETEERVGELDFSDGSGTFVFEDVPEGEYQLEIELFTVGFAPELMESGDNTGTFEFTLFETASVLNFDPTPVVVPEPSSGLMLSAGLLTLAIIRRKR